MIVAFGTYDSARHPRVGILVDGIRARGQDVVECNRPLGFSTAERVRMLKQPWRLPSLALRLARCWAGLTSDSFRLRRGRHADVVLVGYMGHFDVLLARLLFPRSTLVLDHLIFAGGTAKDRGTKAGLRTHLLDALDSLAVRIADLVVVDTAEHAALLPQSVDRVVVPVGARSEWQEAGEVTTSGTGGDTLRVVFFGLFTPLQGAPAMADGVRRALDSGAPLSVTLIGDGQDRAECERVLRDRAEVTWLDWVAPAELPAIVADHDVCLGIFGETEKALRVVPNKVFQGLAAGCVVVTSDTPPQRRLIGDCAELVDTCDHSALAHRLTSLAEDAGELAAARDRAAAGRLRFTSEAVVEPLLDRLAQLDDQGEAR